MGSADAKGPIRLFEGYHGTTQSNAAEIHKSRSFTPSVGPQEWLGDGVYFFERKVSSAEWWVDGHKHYPQWAILKANVRAFSSEIMDFDDDDELAEFERSVDYYLKRCRREGYKPKAPYDGGVINLICSLRGNIKIVRGVYTFGTRYRDKTAIRLGPVQYQLAVRDVDCIDAPSIRVSALGPVSR